LVARPINDKFMADGEDVSSVMIEVQDAQERVVPAASNRVRFNLTGAGKIIGVGNGDPSCHEADKPDSPGSAERSAFSGLCLVFVQATKQAGTVQLAASADELASAMVLIQSNAV
jgi:beta-galactosidase